MSRHVKRPARYALSQFEFVVMGTALSLIVAIAAVAFTLIVVGGYR